MIVGFVLAASLAYVIRMIIRTFKVSRNACGGCKGCAMRSQMMRNQKKKKKEITLSTQLLAKSLVVSIKMITFALAIELRLLL